MLHRVALSCACVCLGAQAMVPVDVEVRATWDTTPLVLEAAEFVANTSAPLFWTFIERVQSDAATDITTDQDEYTHVLDHAAALLGNETLPLLKLSLAIREFSPAVELFNSKAKQTLQHIHQTLSTETGQCTAFAVTDERIFCAAEELTSHLNEHTPQTKTETVYEFDHLFVPLLGNTNTQVNVVLYGRVRDVKFGALYNTLKNTATERTDFNFAVRHYIADQSEMERLAVSGFGVEMAVKNTEYIATDDRGHQKAAIELNKNTQGNVIELQTATEDEIKDLSLQAAQLIAQTQPHHALHTMTDLAHNFPIRIDFVKNVQLDSGAAMAALSAADTLRRDMQLDTRHAHLWINGRTISTKDINPFALAAHLREDTRVMEALLRSGVNMANIPAVLTSKAGDDSGETEGDIVDMRTSAVQFYNNLERDSYTKQWPTQLQMIIRQAKAQQMIVVRKNTLNMIFVTHAIGPDTAGIIDAAIMFKQYQAPVRIGFVFYTSRASATTDSPLATGPLATSSDQEATFAKADDSDDPSASVVAMRVYSYVLQTKSRAKALKWLNALNRQVSTGNDPMEAIYRTLIGVDSSADIDNILKNDKYDTIREISDNFVANANLASDELHVYANGMRIRTNSDLQTVEAVVSQVLRAHQRELVRDVYTGKITDETDLEEYYYAHGKKRVCALLANTNKKSYVGYAVGGSAMGSLYKADGIERMRGRFLEGWNYLYVGPRDGVFTTTYTVVVNLCSRSGLYLTYQALQRMKADENTEAGNTVRLRFAYSHPDKCDSAVTMATIIQSLETPEAVALLSDVVAQTYNRQVEGADDIDAEFTHQLSAHSGSPTIDKTDRAGVQKTTEQDRRDMQQVLLEGRGLGHSFVVVNGRIIGPVTSAGSFLTADFIEVERDTLEWGNKIKGILEDENSSQSAASISDALVRCQSLLGGESVVRDGAPELDGIGLSLINLQREDVANGHLHTVVVLIDPLSSDAQRLTPQLMILREALGASISLYLMPTPMLKTIPLNRFYRFAVAAEPSFSENGRLVSSSVRFAGLPSAPLLTMGVDPPSSWSVMAHKALYDLDNLHLASVTHDAVVATYAITSILLEGHCYDGNQPPQGLQFDLGTAFVPHVTDSLVMNNLGYFQLKANPGIWRLAIRPGRSSEVYKLTTGKAYREIFINRFVNPIETVQVRKRRGQEEASVLDAVDSDDAEQASDSLWSSFKGLMSGASSTNSTRKGQVINVFSIASGHLYERFLSIMILSVLKQTNNPVKFWLFENSLSPTFKDFLPHFAEEKDFDYQLVTYKWPQWLRAQTEKQRIIWGYKILFLDVLFPLDVKRIIFVDADQIVRADLNELMNLDLQGAPYGYTPFCADRDDMAQYRFWDTGYWKTHLGEHMKYHISALYVIDLLHFRQLATGDILRGNYHQLSADPNSLANLDQDLPNSLQPHVQIFSLPQEWLWCETWCSLETKATAKTIDLCNNPETKEPKLIAAKRIVPEWVALDIEVQALHDEVHAAPPAQVETKQEL